MKRKNQIRWEPTAMQKHPDSIISSDYTHFKPLTFKYEKEPPNMFLLLSMEYARKWAQEKEEYDKTIKPKTEVEFLFRKFVLRNLNRKRQITNSLCHLKNKQEKSLLLTKKLK